MGGADFIILHHRGIQTAMPTSAFPVEIMSQHHTIKLITIKVTFLCKHKLQWLLPVVPGKLCVLCFVPVEKSRYPRMQIVSVALNRVISGLVIIYHLFRMFMS
jgi:hypothetical protein